jgi:hypothetical protein
MAPTIPAPAAARKSAGQSPGQIREIDRRGRRVARAWQLLRHLLVSRIAFTPQADGTVAFVGHASIGPLVAGTVLDGLSKAGVSPTRYVVSRGLRA